MAAWSMILIHSSDFFVTQRSNQLPCAQVILSSCQSFPYLMDIMQNLSNSWAGESGGICNSKKSMSILFKPFLKNVPKLYSNQLYSYRLVCPGFPEFPISCLIKKLCLKMTHLFLFSVCVCLHVCGCALSVRKLWQPEDGFRFLELELQVVGNSRVCSGNPAWLLWRAGSALTCWPSP